MKNNIYFIYDKTNDIAVNTIVAIDDNIAKCQVADSLKKSDYLMKNSKDLSLVADLKNYLENAKNYQLKNQKNETILDLSEIIKKLETNKNE